MSDDAITPIPRTTPNPSPHSVGNRVSRVLWGVVQSTLFAHSPRPCFGWRAFLLRRFGARVHKRARVYPKARIWHPRNLTLREHATLADNVDVYCVAKITIGASTTISQYTYLCGATHDFDDPQFPLVPMDITIGERVWVAADCFVGPGVTINDGAVLGARSSAFKDLDAWTVYAGSPARELRKRGFGPLALETAEENDLA
jgi:putative colanic acid biosynthesis acetyltransferase WcaF